MHVRVPPVAVTLAMATLAVLLVNLVAFWTFFGFAYVGAPSVTTAEGELEPDRSSGAPRSEGLKLVSVHLLFRHGMRAPENPYPTDPFQNETHYWPNGWGQLTDYGIEQEYELGKFLRRRYGSFVGSHYSRHELYAVSSDYDRTIMSAQAVLSGFYEPIRYEHDGNKNDSQTFIVPAPVHVLSGKEDRFLRPVKKNCPRLDRLIKETLDFHPEVHAMGEGMEDLFEEFKSNSGSPELKWFVQMGYTIGTLMIEDFHYLSIPSWGKELLQNEKLMAAMTKSLTVLTLTDDLKKLSAGPLIGEIMNNMAYKIGAWTGMRMQKETRKMWLYSGHDITLVNVMNTLGLNDPPLWPSVANILMLELHHDSATNDSFVEVYYRNSTVKKLIIPACGDPCPLSKFTQSFAKFVPTDWEVACRDNGTDSDMSSTSTQFHVSMLDGILIATIVVIAAAFAAFGYWHMKDKRMRRSVDLDKGQ